MPEALPDSDTLFSPEEQLELPIENQTFDFAVALE